MEKLLLKHMGKIAFFFGLIVFVSWILQYINLPVCGVIQNLFGITEIKNTISTQYMFTTIGAIFAFWYGYKKYERDKEIEMIEMLEKQYEHVRRTKKRDLKYYEKLINLWVKEFYYYKNGYLSDERWDYISLRILKKIYNTNKNGLFTIRTYFNLYSGTVSIDDNNVINFKNFIDKKTGKTKNFINNCLETAKIEQKIIKTSYEENVKKFKMYESESEQQEAKDIYIEARNKLNHRYKLNEDNFKKIKDSHVNISRCREILFDDY